MGNDGTFTSIKTVNFSGTGGWQSWSTQVFKLNLPEGNRTLRLYSVSGEYNINWFEISQPADVNEIPQLQKLMIFPNPTDGGFFMEAEFSSMTPVTVTINDLLGNRIFNYSFYKTSSFCKWIDNLDRKPGIYFLRLSTEMGNLTRRIIVN